MNQKTYIINLEKNYKKALEISKRKSHDYAGNDNPFKNFENATILGVSLERGILVRIMDKISRISNLLDKKAKVTDESIEDTLMDLINYSNILLVYLQNKNK